MKRILLILPIATAIFNCYCADLEQKEREEDKLLSTAQAFLKNYFNASDREVKANPKLQVVRAFINHIQDRAFNIYDIKFTGDPVTLTLIDKISDLIYNELYTWQDFKQLSYYYYNIYHPDILREIIETLVQRQLVMLRK